VEDNAALILGEPGDGHAPWSTIHVSWTEWKNDFALEIYCRRAKLQVTGLWGSYGTQTLRIYRMGPELGPPDVEVLEYGDDDQSWAAEWQHFRSAVHEGRQTDVGSALYALGTIEEAYRLSGYGTPAAAR
jgi:hypothetical protein